MLRAYGFSKFTTLFCPNSQGMNWEYPRGVIGWQKRWHDYQNLGLGRSDFRPAFITDTLEMEAQREEVHCSWIFSFMGLEPRPGPGLSDSFLDAGLSHPTSTPIHGLQHSCPWSSLSISPSAWNGTHDLPGGGWHVLWQRAKPVIPHQLALAGIHTHFSCSSRYGQTHPHQWEVQGSNQGFDGRMEV